MLLEGRELELVYDVGKELETTALINVDIEVAAGETVGIMGPSGSGKSSLLSVLSGLRRPSSGSVYFKDSQLDAMDMNELARLRRKEFGFVFQRLHLVDYLNVLDNVMLAAHEKSSGAGDKSYAMHLLEALKLDHVSRKKPNQLSGGQKQRVALARAMINKPSVLFADEPTASLDHRNAVEVVRLLRDLNPEAAIVLVTHDSSILEGADRIIELWDGRVI